MFLLTRELHTRFFLQKSQYLRGFFYIAEFVKGSQRFRPRQSSAAFILSAALVLGGCAGKPDESRRGTAGFVRGFVGGVVADEPRAALVGRDVLSAGGSAVDAAVATYFTLAVTLPSVATLGGGGVCLVHDPAKNTTEMLDFAAPASASVAGRGANSIAGRGANVAVPANARGFFVLHARYGRLKWAQILAPSANAARFGVRVSRALAADLTASGGAIMAEPSLRRVFGRRDGAGPLAEGEQLLQIDLAAMLERIRGQGPGYLHIGAGAAELARAYQAAGLSLTREDLRDLNPAWRRPISLPIEIGGTRLLAHFAAPPASGGAVTAKIAAQALAEGGRHARAGAGDRAALIAEAAGQAENERRPTPSPSDGSAATTIVAADSEGMAVACALTPNAPFGAGRMAPGTGIIAAAAPDASGRGPAALTAALAHERRRNDVVFAGAASGGAAAAAALAQVMAELGVDGRLMEDALAAPRVYRGGPAGAVYHENHLPDAARQVLAARGLRPSATPTLGNVGALYCPGGLLGAPAQCALRADGRGFGLAVGAD